MFALMTSSGILTFYASVVPYLLREQYTLYSLCTLAESEMMDRYLIWTLTSFSCSIESISVIDNFVPSADLNIRPDLIPTSKRASRHLKNHILMLKPSLVLTHKGWQKRTCPTKFLNLPTNVSRTWFAPWYLTHSVQFFCIIPRWIWHNSSPRRAAKYLEISKQAVEAMPILSFLLVLGVLSHSRVNMLKYALNSTQVIVLLGFHCYFLKLMLFSHFDHYSWMKYFESWIQSRLLLLLFYQFAIYIHNLNILR